MKTPFSSGKNEITSKSTLMLLHVLLVFILPHPPVYAHNAYSSIALRAVHTHHSPINTNGKARRISRRYGIDTHNLRIKILHYPIPPGTYITSSYLYTANVKTALYIYFISQFLKTHGFNFHGKACGKQWKLRANFGIKLVFYHMGTSSTNKKYNLQLFCSKLQWNPPNSYR